jgi:hypothetical protein
MGKAVVPQASLPLDEAIMFKSSVFSPLILQNAENLETPASHATVCSPTIRLHVVDPGLGLDLKVRIPHGTVSL